MSTDPHLELFDLLTEVATEAPIGVLMQCVDVLMAEIGKRMDG
jgi:hypothetical protein